ncbi:MAG: DUF4123 domain-containing protein [Burkholderiales bacterium]|nr:DUF4123 domain-containing protein [Burkholderiales bacterium]
MGTLLAHWAGYRTANEEPPFALIDAAGFEGGRRALPDLAFSQLECLFTGDLATELEDVGPYLAQFRSWDEVCANVAEDLLTADTGVLVVPGPGGANHAPSFSDLHRHFRKFNVVYGPDSTALFFRYYDPRVLQSALRVMEPDQLAAFFGPVRHFLVQAPGAMRQMSIRAGKLAEES